MAIVIFIYFIFKFKLHLLISSGKQGIQQTASLSFLACSSL